MLTACVLHRGEGLRFAASAECEERSVESESMYRLYPEKHRGRIYPYANGRQYRSLPGNSVDEQLQTPVSRDDLLSRILDRYDTDEKTAAADLDALLAELKQMEVIEE